jgi:Hydrazine synthase alpha subunit middle domain/WD40-like Beta Propeller Repeat
MLQNLLLLSIIVLAQLFFPAQAAINNPIVFVTQVPVTEDYRAINSAFSNHQADVDYAGRGGDLWVRYPDGALKNLTAAAGFGQVGLQGARAIQVRDPAVHWDGKKIIFSMVVGAPLQYQEKIFYWQLYEMAGLAKNEKPVITKVARQPTNYNNISPAYGSDGRIIFVSDRPRGGQVQLYPQLDEYESEPSNTGLWSLNSATGLLQMLTHAPSGDFNPFVDSYGRVIFTRWDHLQQDQQATADRNGTGKFGTFNYASEAANAQKLNSRVEVFPEPRTFDGISLAGTKLYGHDFNHFFPWQVNEDGTGLELVNHVGRHELGGTFVDGVFTDDPALLNSYNGPKSVNLNKISNFFQIKQDPTNLNSFIGVDAPEFDAHTSGQIVRLMNVAPNRNADQMTIDYLTDKTTASSVAEGKNSPTTHSGHYRDPLMTAGGTLLAAHTFETRMDKNEGSISTDGSNIYPKSRYAFRLRSLKKLPNGIWTTDQLLTKGIKKNITYYDPSNLVHYSNELWELQPVEVKARPKPAKLLPKLDAPEKLVLQEKGISEASLRQYLKTKNLALAIMRNVTRRDHKDTQQPFNLAVAGSGAKTLTGKGKIYEVAHFQVFQADQIRGLTGCCSSTAKPGRRVLAQPLHSVTANPPLAAGAPQGSVKIAKDGSVAMLLPTQRAITWQLTDKKGNFVVRERNWLSMQPGEIHTCPACHGVNSTDQIGQKAPVNKPQALGELLVYLKSQGLK